MNVLLAGNHLSARGGSRGPIEDLAERLSQGGYRCICVSPVMNGALRAAHLIGTALLRQTHYDVAVVDLYSGRAFRWGDALSRILSRLNKPFVLVLHGGNLPEHAKANPAAVRTCLSRATAVVAPSGYLIDTMRPYCPAVRYIPNPVDVTRLPHALRRTARPRLVWVRAFHRIYNPVLAPRMLREVLKQHPDATLTMVGGDKGDGSYQQTVEEARRLDVSDRIVFAGRQKHEQVGCFLRDADIFISTTDYDNTPVSVLEAMACGLCVVSTAVGGVPWLIEHGVNGLLVPPGDASAMATAVTGIVDNPALAARLSTGGRRTALQSDWRSVLPQWQKLLTDIAHVPAAPSGRAVTAMIRDLDRC